MADDTTATSRVVTIDLDDADLLVGLSAELNSIAIDRCGYPFGACPAGDSHWRTLGEALEVLLPKPKPEEPTGFGAVVRDEDEDFCRVDDDNRPWRNAQGEWHSWSHFSNDVEILFPGVAQ